MIATSAGAGTHGKETLEPILVLLLAAVPAVAVFRRLGLAAVLGCLVSAACSGRRGRAVRSPFEDPRQE